MTVTHPDVECYFMTVSEAAPLVRRAAAIGEHGETLVLDIGKPVRILDVAQQMLTKAGSYIAIHFTGLRPAEKLTEVSTGAGEVAVARSHPLVMHVRTTGRDLRVIKVEFPH